MDTIVLNKNDSSHFLRREFQNVDYFEFFARKFGSWGLWFDLYPSMIKKKHTRQRINRDNDK